MYTGLLRMASEKGLHHLMMGTGGDEMFTVDLGYGADCLGQGDILGLWRFYRMWQRSSPFSSLVVMRYVIWHHALKVHLKRLTRSIARQALTGEQRNRLRR